MCLDPQIACSVPKETARVAQAAFPKGNLYLKMRDELGPIFEDRQFANLFPPRGQPAEAPWRLALVTVMQFAEGLSDRQAVEAVRSRIDWKYALGIELSDSGFDSTVLCEFRARLLKAGAEEQLFETLLNRCRERGLVKARGKQRTDSTHVLAAIRALNRLELVRETMRHVLDALAVAAPDWLRAQAPPHWVERYGHRADKGRLLDKPQEQQASAQRVGADGSLLLSALYAPDAPAELRLLPAVEVLRRVWVQNYYQSAEGLSWREGEDIAPASQFISSPYDLDAHLARKGSTCWVGYKIHVTETCEDDLPPLITQVQTTPGPIADGAVTPRIHGALQSKGLLPSTHIVDTGFLDAELLVTSKRDFAVDLLGPTRPNWRWHRRAEDGFGVQHFQIDWEAKRALCPAGCTSAEWVPKIDVRGNEVVYIRFSSRDCTKCSERARCFPTEKQLARRSITVRPQEQHEALQAARVREKTEAYAQEYARRAGIEGTLSRGVRRCGLRRCRYIGEAKVHLSNVLTATALNFVRLGEWLAGVPRAKTRQSPFARLMVLTAAA